MTLPTSGNPITFSQVDVELGLSATAQISMNDTAVRTLFGVSSGAIGMSSGFGKSNTSVPGAPTGVSASASSSSAISVSFSAPACTGNLTIDTYQVVCTSSGSNSATGASSPISVTGLSAGTSYTFKVRAHNSKGYGCYSSTASATTQSPPYMCITTVGATVYTCCSYFTCGNVKTAVWLGSGSFTVNSLGTTSGYGNRVGALFAGGGGGGSYINAGGGGNINGGVHPNSVAGIATGASPYNIVTTKTYTVTVGGGGSGSSSCTAGNGTNSYISCFVSSGTGGGGARGQYSGHYGSICVCASELSCSSKTGSYISGAGGGGVLGVGSHGPAGGYGGGGSGGASYSPCSGYTSRLSGGNGGGGGGGYYNYYWNSCNGVGYGVAGMDAGIGGISINNSVTRSPGSGTTNRSGGGGGGAYNGSTWTSGGSGGSGFVVLKWRYK